jgi:N-acetylmuramoyl-L-alanine amidase
LANELLKKLATIYAQDDIRYPQLRAVTLAQWMLESGRCTSDLAQQNYNCAGLKWRPEMAGVATEVSYHAHDGVDSYCKFATLESFIAGYWIFLNRSPYTGWEDHVASGIEFIEFIGPIYTPSPGYAQRVLDLVPEAEALLASVAVAPEHAASHGATKLGTIVLDPGHGGTSDLGGSAANHAISISGVKEKKLTLDFCMTLRDQLIAKASAANKQVNVVLTRTADVNVSLANRAKVVADNKGKLFLILHFNGFNNPEAQGVETYYKANGNANLQKDKQFCKLVQDALVVSLRTINPHTKDRGVKLDTESGPGGLGVLNDHAMGNDTLSPKCRAAYVELEFITNPAVEKNLISGANAMSNRQRVMGALADAMLGYIETF